MLLPVMRCVLCLSFATGLGVSLKYSKGVALHLNHPQSPFSLALHIHDNPHHPPIKHDGKELAQVKLDR